MARQIATMGFTMGAAAGNIRDNDSCREGLVGGLEVTGGPHDQSESAGQPAQAFHGGVVGRLPDKQAKILCHAADGAGEHKEALEEQEDVAAQLYAVINFLAGHKDLNYRKRPSAPTKPPKTPVKV